MFKSFYPDLMHDSVYTLDFEKIYKDGYKGVIFDIDNTLVEHGKPATDRAIALFEKLREIGFKTCLLSNNKEYRVKPFADAVSSPYIYKADKPSRRNYYKAMEIMGTDKNTTIFIGDQLFTDVYGARRTGIYSVLTSPIDKKEEIQIVLKRYLEKIVLYFYRRAK